MSITSEEPLPKKLFNPADKIPDFQIDDVTRKALCFREDLMIGIKDELTSSTRPIGSYCISLESIGPEGMEFMVQILSSLMVNDSLAGSKLLSSITAKLHCLEERRREFEHREDGLNEKTLYIGLEDDLYHLEGEEICPCDKSKWQKDLPLSSSGELISEGANLLLMRYLAVNNFHGSLSFKSVMIGGQLTTCNYKCSEARIMKFNDRMVQVYTIERKIQEECGLVHNTETHMTRGGYILRHDWLEVPYLLIINSLIDPNEIGQRKRSRVIAPLRSRWNSDIQMMSIYMDKKTYNIAQQSEYLAEHPEIKQLISDYTQTLLAVKPIDVLSFTIQHFAAFAREPDPSESEASGESNPDVLNAECDHGAQSSFYPLRRPRSPEFSLCSVFSKCPSSASCVKRSSGDGTTTPSCLDDCEGCKSNGRKNNSLCSFHTECGKTCEGCRDSIRDKSLCSFYPECDKTCEGCKNSKKSKSLCSFYAECEKTCEGCKRSKKDKSLCSFYPECDKTCEGCKDSKKDKSLCSFYPDCDKTCKGCKNSKKDKSLCSFYPECDKTCKGCKKSKKAKSLCNFYPECGRTWEGCKDLKKDKSLCSFHPECGKTCEGCKDSKKDKSLCSFYPECDKTCEGCKNLKKDKSLCSFYPECGKTCKGCKNSKKDKSLCSFYPDCDKTCKGCKNLRKDESLCSFYPDCDKTCEGCKALRKPCSVHKVCPECPGCHRVCSEIAVCPNCTECNVEIPPMHEGNKQS